MREASSVLPSAEPRHNSLRSSNTPTACNFTSQRRPPAALCHFLTKRRHPLLREGVPDLCQRIADLGALADLGRRENSKLRAFNGQGGTDSVPGHHVFKNLQACPNAVLFHFIPKLMARPVCLRGVKCVLGAVFQRGRMVRPRPSPKTVLHRIRRSGTPRHLHAGFRGPGKARDGQVIARIPSRQQLRDGNLRSKVQAVEKALAKLRARFDELVRSGIVRHCGCNEPTCPVYFMSSEAAHELEHLRRDALRLFHDAHQRFQEPAW